MIRSMTGYGASSIEALGFKIGVELRSVNNRHLDCSVRLPRIFMFAEEGIKSAVQSHISRGKVDVFVTVDASAADSAEVRVNEPLLESYISALTGAVEKYGLYNDMSVVNLARLPDVLSVEKKDTDKDALSVAIREAAELSLCEFDKMREREGKALCEDIERRIQVIYTLTAQVEERSPKTVADYRAKLLQKMQDVLGTAGIEESRILTEAAIFADKVATDEETVRLRSHLAQLSDLLGGASPVGRKMDFLVQEINREANTIGSKCQSTDIAHTVVEIKSEIEKIREQIQNLE